MPASPSPVTVPNKIYFEMWKRTGITEHMGGIEATRRLVGMMRVAPGQRLLDIGCGTGYTAVYLARDPGVQVVCIDILGELLLTARNRAIKAGVSGRISFVRADAQHLLFRSGTFDRTLAESVLAFCDAGRVADEVGRILKPGGIFGDNELTFLKPPSRELLDLLSPSGGLGITPLAEPGWVDTYKKAGMNTIASLRRLKSHRLPV